MNFLDERLPMRFWDKVIPEPNSGCWLWLAATVNDYGTFGRGRSGLGNVRAHRFTYETLVGPIPNGLELDHLCRTPRCCNPLHLEPVTHTENLRRGTWAEGRDRLHESQRARTTCTYGHELSGEGVFYVDGKRRCRECERRRGRASGVARRARHRALGLCWQCDERSVDGKSECQRHLEISRVRDRLRRAVKRAKRAA